ncbi:MAG TPA: phosphoglycolate phosphatase [Burkholderiales bacterium]|nr:phosphoglycolate phosphatase [Burkholderiales bacterium]
MNRQFPLVVKAVMIDLDGTLADTIPDLAVATNLMLRELDRPELDVALVRTFVGKGIPNLVGRALSGRLDGETAPDLLARAMPIYERYYTEVNGRNATLYPGVMEGLAALRAAQFPLACVTNKSGKFTLPLLDHLGLSSYFAQVVAGDTLPQKKPDPAQLLYACRNFAVAPHEMLFVGDSVNDAQAARAAGCPVFCVTYGYNEGRDVRELDVDAIVTSLLEAARLVVRIA